MSFNNSGYIPSQPNNLATNIASLPMNSSSRNVALNAPMVNRIYNAKPGCSACGKKVA
jgi:hypothetical protein